ncbi:hypothetical protein ACFS4T_27580 [Pseudomonas lini]
MKLQRLDDAYREMEIAATAGFENVMENFAQEDFVIHKPAGLRSDEQTITSQSITNDMNAFRGKKSKRARETIVRYKQRQGQAIPSSQRAA